jgi:RNA polymerase sigma factor (sigma-70 family)
VSISISDESEPSACTRADAAAYGQICESIAPRLACLCRRLVGPDMAEDLAQDVLLRVWERRAMFDPERGPFVGWVFAIARNMAVDRRRAQARWADSWNDLCTREKDQPPQTLEARVLARIHAQDVRRSVARLPSPNGGQSGSHSGRKRAINRSRRRRTSASEPSRDGFGWVSHASMGISPQWSRSRGVRRPPPRTPVLV